MKVKEVLKINQSKRNNLLTFFSFIFLFPFANIAGERCARRRERKTWLSKKNRRSLPLVSSHEAGKCGRPEVLKHRVFYARNARQVALSS